MPSTVERWMREKTVIVVMSRSPARAAKQATSIIPIVVGGMADPVGDELIVSLARPGGNITGTTFLGPELIAKRFGLFKAAIPGLARVAALWHPAAYGKRTMDGILKETEAAARKLDIALQPLDIRGTEDFEAAFATAVRGNAHALIVFDDGLTVANRPRIAALAASSRLPAMYGLREFPDDGGLISYGPSFVDLMRRSATYIDKILKGAKPADLPVEQPTKFELVINRKTANALGLSVPPTLLAQADDVID